MKKVWNVGIFLTIHKFIKDPTKCLSQAKGSKCVCKRFDTNLLKFKAVLHYDMKKVIIVQLK